MSPCQDCAPKREAGEAERHSPVHLIVEKKQRENSSDPSSKKIRTKPSLSLKKNTKKQTLKFQASFFSRVPRSPPVLLLFVPKWLLLVTENTCLLLFGFASPCSNMFTAPGPADRSNIWLLCTAERAHSTYIIHDASRTSARRREPLYAFVRLLQTPQHTMKHTFSLCVAV